MDRAPDFGSVGCGFDSCLGRLIQSVVAPAGGMIWVRLLPGAPCFNPYKTMNKSLMTRLFHRIQKKVRSFFVLDQWEILVAPETEYTSLSWEKLKSLTPPKDRFWADPFVWVQNGIHYLFIEELLFSNHRGRIACLQLDKALNIVSNRVVLERPYHLSYPFLFEYSGQLYMIPETGKNNAIELYRCIQFPDQWQFEKTLINNIRAVDTTLLESDGKWWLFTNIHEEGGSSWDTLHLYYSDNPLSENWTAHPKNPIVKDIHSARPAGRIFSHNRQLIRPSQNCSPRYGYAINFNEIITLNEMEYAETTRHAFTPPSKGTIQATHTYNSAAGITVIDANIRRRKF